MLIIQRFSASVVRIYSRDHRPPHFHVLLNDGREVCVNIYTLEIIRGQVAERELADVLAWARERQACFVRLFEELQR